MSVPARPHAVPAGPLAVRWLAHELPLQLAGATTVGRLELENAGTAAWRSRPGRDIHLSYHWLDPLGNPIVWAGAFILLPERVEPGERISVFVTVRAPIPPGAYRLAFDLVNEGRYWFRELGNERLELDVDVLPRLARRALAVTVVGDDADLAALTCVALQEQDEPVAETGTATAYLPAGARPAPDWSRRVLDAHEEGYAAVGGSIELTGVRLQRRALARELAPWRAGFGRSPAGRCRSLCPSVSGDVTASPSPGPAGLPAARPSRAPGAGDVRRPDPRLGRRLQLCDQAIVDAREEQSAERKRSEPDGERVERHRSTFGSWPKYSASRRPSTIGVSGLP